MLDIDKAVKIVRETESEADVVPNLMIGFGIDEIQAEYVAEIKLRHLNREYILKRISDIEALENEIAELEKILSSEVRKKKIIISELENVIKNMIRAENRKYFMMWFTMILRMNPKLPIIPLPLSFPQVDISKKSKRPICA